MAEGVLNKAKRQKSDEFYTQLSDIEKELKHYKGHFKDKIVFCNCDDPYWSNFFYFFVAKFNDFGLKKLISTHYIDNDITLFDDIKPEKPYSLTITKAPKDLLTLERPAMVTHIIAENSGRNYLKGDGDFRSPECITMLQEADIIVTNPPFSLFREYVAQLMEYEKKFLIIGDQNALSYKDVFLFVKENKMWLGVDNGGTKWFQVPPHYEIQTLSRIKTENGIKYFSKGNIAWFTNLDHKKRHENIILYRKYTPEEFPKYDNYDAIEVSTYKDIPADYDGVMGVPITFLDKYNPDQFEILGLDDHRLVFPQWRGRGPDLNGKPLYRRIIIKKKK